MAIRVSASLFATAALLAVGACERSAGQGQRLAQSLQPAAKPVTAGSSAPFSFAPIVAKVAPSVVSIDTATPLGRAPAFPFGLPQAGPGAQTYALGSGSGFLVSPDGYIVTNNHVVADAREIRVTLQDQRVFPAKIVGRDEPTDLAVVKIEARGMPFVSFENSATPQVGDWVIAVGNPFGLGNTATAGIVSAYARDIGESYVSYLQIDAPINRGNSGGPSFDTAGRVIGVNSAIFSPSGGSIGIGFAIPADLAADVTKQLIDKGVVTRGYLGAGVGDMTPAVAEELGLSTTRGAVIGEITPGGPAARAGLLPGDVVVAVEGQPVASARELIRRVASSQAGSNLRLEFVRGGRRSTTQAKVGRRTG